MKSRKIKKIKDIIKKIHFKTHKAYIRTMASMTCGVAIFMNDITASADTDEPWKFLTDGPTGNDPFGGVTSALKDILSSFFNMVLITAISYMACAALGIAFAFTKKNAVQRDEAKDRFVYLIGALLIIFGIGAFFSTIQTVALGISEAIK